MRPQCPPSPTATPPAPPRSPLGLTGGSWGKPSTGMLGLRAACIPSPIASPPQSLGAVGSSHSPPPPGSPPRARFPVPWRPILGPGAPGAVRCGREALRTQQPGGAGASLAAAASAPAPAPSIPARPRFGPMEPPPGRCGGNGGAMAGGAWGGGRGGGSPLGGRAGRGHPPHSHPWLCSGIPPHPAEGESPGWGAPEGPPRSLLTPWRWHPAGRGGGGGDVRPSGSRGVPGVVLAQPRAVPGVWVKVQRLGMNPRSVGGFSPRIFQGWRVFLAKKRGVGRGSECRVSQLCWG